MNVKGLVVFLVWNLLARSCFSQCVIVMAKNESYQLVGMVRGTVTSVYKRVPLEFCKARCSVDSGCNSFEYSVKHAGRCRLLNEATPAVTTLFSDSEAWLYVKEHHPKPDFYQDFTDVDGLVFHNGADLAIGIHGIVAVVDRSQKQWIELGDLSQYSCIVKPSLCGATGGGSISVWTKVGSCNHGGGVLTSLRTLYSEGFAIISYPDRDMLRFQVNERHQSYRIDAEIPDNEWFQVVMVHKGSSTPLRVHVSGDVRTGNILSSNIAEMSSGEVVIGRKYLEEDGWYCSAMVDELMLWNRSLTQEEMENVMSEN